MIMKDLYQHITEDTITVVVRIYGFGHVHILPANRMVIFADEHSKPYVGYFITSNPKELVPTEEFTRMHNIEIINTENMLGNDYREKDYYSLLYDDFHIKLKYGETFDPDKIEFIRYQNSGILMTELFYDETKYYSKGYSTNWF